MHCEIVDYVLALQVEDFDALRRSGTQPVTVGREDKGIDNVTCLQRVQVLALVKIPQHRDSVLATWCSKRTIGWDRHSVNIAGVTIVVGLQLELGKFPNLEWKCNKSAEQVEAKKKDEWYGRQRSWWFKWSHRSMLLWSSKYFYNIIRKRRAKGDVAARHETYLDNLVPSDRNDDRVHDIRAESDTRYPANAFHIKISNHILQSSHALTTQCDHHL